MFQTKVTFSEGQTPQQRKAHAAHWRREDARRRAINNGLGFWRVCAKRQCRRSQTCSHDMHACFERHWALVPEEDREYLRGGILAKRDGAAGDEIIRAAEARRADYLKSLEANNAPAASPLRADDNQAAPPMEVRIRRL
jgi:hypothetical protein